MTILQWINETLQWVAIGIIWASTSALINILRSHRQRLEDIEKWKSIPWWKRSFFD